MSAAAPAETQSPHRAPATLQGLESKNLSYGDATVKFSYAKDGTPPDVLTVSIINKHSGQTLSYAVADASKYKNDLIRLSEDIESAGNAKHKNHFLQSRIQNKQMLNCFERLEKEFGATQVTADFINPQKRPEEFKTLEALKGDASLHGFTPNEALPTTKREMLTDIKRGKQSIVLTDGATELELTIGDRTEISIRVPGGRPPSANIGKVASRDENKAVFAIEFDEGPSSAEVMAGIKAILPLLKGKTAADIFVGSEKAPQGSELLMKMLEMGKLSRIKNVDLENIKLLNKEVSDQLQIVNVVAKNSTIDIPGAFSGVDFRIGQGSHAMLHSAGSLLSGFYLERGAVITGDPMSDKSGLQGSTFLACHDSGGKPLPGNELHGNGYGCDMRGIIFMNDKGAVGTVVKPDWPDFKGLIFDFAKIDQGIASMGRKLTTPEYAKVLKRHDVGFAPQDFGKNLLAMSSEFKLVKEEDVVDATGGAAKKYRFSNAEGDRELFAVVSQVDPSKLADPNNRVHLTYSTILSDGVRDSESSFSDTRSALYASMNWLLWRDNTTPPTNDVRAGIVVDPATLAAAEKERPKKTEEETVAALHAELGKRGDVGQAIANFLYKDEIKWTDLPLNVRTTYLEIKRSDPDFGEYMDAKRPPPPKKK